MITHTQPTEFIEGLDSDRLASAQDFLGQQTRAGLEEWATQHTNTYGFKSTTFNMSIERGENPDQVLVVGGEFGNGSDAIGAVARALLIRHLVAPDASLILQPNTTLSQNNTRFTDNEGQQLKKGDRTPLTHRYQIALAAINNPAEMIVYGPSQGGVAVLDLAAHKDMPPMATTIMEAPNVARRSFPKMMLDFLGAGKELKQTISNNFETDSALEESLLSDLSIAGLAKYGLGALREDNLSLVGVIRRATATEDIKTALSKGGTVVHAWAEGDKVSPAVANVAVAREIERDGPTHYEARSFPGDHSITNNYILNAALVDRSIQLEKR